VALSFAAEQLFTAAQLLTSDMIAPEHALRLACDQHISQLLDHQQFLPVHIVARLQQAQRHCSNAQSLSINKPDAEALASEVMTILREVSAALQNPSHSSAA
jgi:diadenosine tetraphosphate (Ap4A) HIT family hydrolase